MPPLPKSTSSAASSEPAILSLNQSSTFQLASEQTPVPMIDLTEQHQTIAGEVEEAVSGLFASQRFVLGDAVAEFEQQVADYCDAKHTVGCASGTDALILALMALNIGEGDEVITSPFSFFATASSIWRVGAKPVFVDIDPVTYNLDTDQVAAAITSRTKAIMPVHLFGQCAEMEPLWRLSVEHEVAIVEDAAQAIGATYRGRAAGVLGSLGCFSFFPTKNLGGAGDGGMVTTDDPELAERIKRLRVHGDVGRYNHIEVGLNSRLDALQAAILSVKLRHLDHWHELRRLNASRYESMFAACGLDADMIRPAARVDGEHVYNQYVVRVPNGRRDRIKASLTNDNIGAAVYYPISLHEQKCFEPLGYQHGDFPGSERACHEVLALPIYPELGLERQYRVVQSLAKACGKSFTTPIDAFVQPSEIRRAA